MDEANPKQSQDTTPKPSPKITSNIWKYFSFALITLLVGIGGYLIGKQQAVPQTHSITQQPTKTQIHITPTATMNISPIISTVVASPTNLLVQPAAGKKINAGIQTAIFTQYTITVSPGWVVNHQVDPTGKTDSLTLMKGSNFLAISQSAGGAGSCTFSGETPQPMGESFTNFVPITGTANLEFRRGMLQDNNYSICENKAGSFVYPTSFGYITYIISDKSLLPEMDAMVASLTK